VKDQLFANLMPKGIFLLLPAGEGSWTVMLVELTFFFLDLVLLCDPDKT